MHSASSRLRLLIGLLLSVSATVAADIRLRSAGGQTVTMDIPPIDATANVIIEFREPPLLARGKAATSLRSLHVRLAADLARIDLEVHRRRGGAPTAWAQSSGTRYEYKLAFAGASARVEREAFPAIAALPYVKAVYEDRRVRATLDRSVPLIGAPKVWSAHNARGRGIVVAIVDSGIDYTHPALGGGFGPQHKVAGGYDFAYGDDDPMDDNGHGTHVAGIVAGNVAPVIGVAPEATLLAYKVLDQSGAGHDSAILAAIEKVVDPNGDGDVSDHADIANLSLGRWASNRDPVVDAVERATAAGVVFCVSAGNNGITFSVGSPAVAPSVIAVAASDEDDQLASFSSLGPYVRMWAIKPEVAAPGVDIDSAAIGGGTVQASGTSMAAPHIAGVAALVRELHPDWSPQEVKSAIISTAKMMQSIVGAGGGRVQADAAVEASILPSPATITFGVASGSTTRTLRLTNRGDTSRTVTIAADSVPAGVTLSVSPPSVTVPRNETVEVSVVLSLSTTEPFRNDRGIATSGHLRISTTQSVQHVPWMVISGDIVTATYEGEDESAIAITRNGEVVGLGIGTVAAVAPGSVDVALFTTTGEERMIIRESVPVKGVASLAIAPEEATLSLHIAGTDENGRLLSSYDVPSSFGGDYWIEQEVGLPSGVTLEWRPGGSLLVSPLRSTTLKTLEIEVGEGLRAAARMGLHRLLTGLASSETLTLQPGDWASETFAFPCATQCASRNSELALRTGQRMIVVHPFAGLVKGNTFKLALTKPRVGMEAHEPSMQVSIVEDDRPGLGFSKPWSILSPRFRGSDTGQIVMQMTDEPWPVDYVAPHSEEPQRFGYGPNFIRTNMGIRWTQGQFDQPGDQWSVEADVTGALGEDLADDASLLAVTMFDANTGRAIAAERIVTGNFRLVEPLASGRYRLQIVSNYRLSEVSRGRGTLTADIDTRTDATAPTLTCLRVLNAAGQPATTLQPHERAHLLLAARQSTFPRTSFQVHSEIDAAATHVWWRPSGGTVWYELDVSLIGSSYTSAGTAGPAGTMVDVDLSPVTSGAQGPIDLKIDISNPRGSTTHWLMEPGFFVAPLRRRSARH